MPRRECARLVDTVKCTLKSRAKLGAGDNHLDPGAGLRSEIDNVCGHENS
jgi:hypothetical protein